MIYPVVAIAFTMIATRISLGLGLATVFSIGYFHGIIRANIVSVYTSFLFDSAVLGLYLSLVLLPPNQPGGKPNASLVKWITALTLWPLLIAVIPQNDLFVQFVAFRATAWFLPMLWIGSRLTAC